jgi:hypothetical protein
MQVVVSEPASEFAVGGLLTVRKDGGQETSTWELLFCYSRVCASKGCFHGLADKLDC